MKHQPEINTGTARKGIITRAILRLWAFFTAFVRLFTRLVVGFIVAIRFAGPPHAGYNEFGQSVDSEGQPRLDPYD